MATGPFISEFDTPALAPGTDFDKEFKKKVATFPKEMSIAVVDLTDGLPKFGVTNENQEKHVFSLAKICLPLAAYRLQERLRSNFSTESVKDIEKAWRGAIKGKAKHIGVDDFPKLDRIFKPPTGGKWDFDFQETKADWNTLDGYDSGDHDSEGAIPKSTIDTLGFLDRLKLSVRMSDDNAAGSVIEDLGFAFINATLLNEGYYSAKNHGLWVGSSYSKVYANRVYVVEPAGDDITVGGTANTVALFMTRLHRGTLVKDYGKYKPSDEIRDIMKEMSTSDIGTFSRFSMAGGVSKASVKYSKIGLDYAKASEGAIIERLMTTNKKATKTMRYVAVALQSMDQMNMPKIAKAIDDYVESVHKDD
jgi:hypothetical protein